MPLSPDEEAEINAEARRLHEMQELPVTPPDQWKSPRKIGFVVELPSGNVMRVRRTMSLQTMVEEGLVPNPLGQIVSEMIAAGQAGLDLKGLTQEAQIQALDLIDQTIVGACVEPTVHIPPEGENPILWEPPLGGISIMDLNIADRLYITQVAHGGSTDLRKFREQQTGVVEPVSDGEGVQPAAKPASRAQRRSGTGKKKPAPRTVRNR